MENIEEKAIEYANAGVTLFMDTAEEDIIYRDGLALSYAAGAKWMHEELTRWNYIPADKSGFAAAEALDEILRELPRLVKDKRDGCIELIDYDNASEWRGDLERKPSRYQWRPIHE